LALVDVLKELEAESGTRLNVDLKWPNDVLLSQKKVAGILLETAHSGGGDFAAVVGVGINVKAECVPEELRQSATSIEEEAGKAIPRRRLLVRYLGHFQRVLELFERGEHSRILERWKNNSSMCDGVSVRVIEGNTTRLGITCGLTEIGALRIRMAEGVEETVLAGDVSVRRHEA
jgi:BirA family biotin operon repressor/biotin-[acetyl-CoA-carboxylase] ligase